MSAMLVPIDALNDPRDRALFAQTPLVPMPRFGELEPLPVGRRRYVAAADGIYVQARHRALDLTLLLALARLPFGPLEAQVNLIGALIPETIFREIQCRAIAHAPNEWAGLVHWDEAAQCYTLTEPPVLHRSTCRIQYASNAIDPEQLVLDVHSHGYGPDFFSAEDDESDEFGFYFATVLGHCESQEALTARTRLVIDGHHFDLPWHPWQDDAGCAAHLPLSASMRS